MQPGHSLPNHCLSHAPTVPVTTECNHHSLSERQRASLYARRMRTIADCTTQVSHGGNQSGFCASCTCSACWICAPQTRRSRASALLVILLRGQALRIGTQFSRDSSSGPEQFEALRNALLSLREQIVEPLEASGWTLEAIADIGAPDDVFEPIQAMFKAVLRTRLKALRVAQLQRTQSRSVLHSLDYALASAALSPPSLWHALLLVRHDLLWRVRLPFPPPSHLREDELMALWRVDHEDSCAATAVGLPWVNDVLFLLPARLVQTLWGFLVWNHETHGGRNYGLHLLLHSPGTAQLSTRLLFAPCAYNSNPRRGPQAAPKARINATWPLSPSRLAPMAHSRVSRSPCPSQRPTRSTASSAEQRALEWPTAQRRPSRWRTSAVS